MSPVADVAHTQSGRDGLTSNVALVAPVAANGTAPGSPVPAEGGMNETQLALMAELTRKQPRHVLIDGVWVSQPPGDDGDGGSHG